MINWGNLISQMFNGLVLGALLALISSGLTIIYGTLGVLNLAHGAMFMLGGYAGDVAFTYTDSFLIAIIFGSLFVMVVGLVMELVIIRHFYSRPDEDQLLVTFGIGMCMVELVRLAFGSLSLWFYGLRVGLIPRAFAAFALVGYFVHLTGVIAELLGFPIGTMLLIPGALFEVALPFWLFFKGFNAGAYGKAAE